MDYIGYLLTLHTLIRIKYSHHKIMIHEPRKRSNLQALLSVSTRNNFSEMRSSDPISFDFSLLI